MTMSIPQLSATMSPILTTTATTLARDLTLVQRTRVMDGGQFARTLILGWLEQPHASRSDLVRIAQDHGVTISIPGLQHWIAAPTAVPFFAKLLTIIAAHAIAGPAIDQPLFQRFSAIWLHDSTTITLPAAVAESFPGCGGQRNGRAVGTAGGKAQVRIDAITGRLDGPILQAARDSDRAVAFRHRPARGSVQVRDLGYFALDDLARDDADGRFWVSRLKPNTAIWHHGERKTLETWLPTHGSEPQEFAIQLGSTQQIPCRLIMVPLPTAVADGYRRTIRATARRKGRTPRAATLALAGWLLIVTNIPPAAATLAEVVVLLRLRWRIELLFKAWKAPQGITHIAGKERIPILVEWYAKWCGLILAHGVMIVSAWNTVNWSLTMALPAMQRHIRDLGRAWIEPAKREAVLHAIATMLRTLRLRDQSHERPTLDDILRHPELSLQKYLS